MKIVKDSEDGVVDGIKFTITGNGVNQTVTTKNDGVIQVDNLRPGTYTVTEVVEDRYEPQTAKTVTVVSGQTATVSFVPMLTQKHVSSPPLHGIRIYFANSRIRS